MPEPIFMKLGTYIMAPKPISVAYFIISFHRSVCIWIPLSLLGNGSVKTLPRQRIHMQQSIVGGVVLYAVRVVSTKSRWLVLPRSYCFLCACNLQLSSNRTVYDVTTLTITSSFTRMIRTDSSTNEVLPDFTQYVRTNAEIVPQIRSRSLPFFFPLHH
jgi:hypothetical protein